MNYTDYPNCEILDDTELEDLTEPPAQPEMLDWSHEPALSKRPEPNQLVYKPVPLSYKQTLLAPITMKPPVSCAIHNAPLDWLTPQFIAMYGVPLIPFPTFQPIQTPLDDDEEEDPPYAPMTPPLIGATETDSQCFASKL